MNISVVTSLVSKLIDIVLKILKCKKEELAETPRLHFAIGYSSGPGDWKYSLHIENQSDQPAYDLAIYLPGIEGRAWTLRYLKAETNENYYIPLPNSSPVRTQPQEGLIARLIYHNRYNKQFTLELELIQERRADGLYNITSKGSVIKHKN